MSSTDRYGIPGRLFGSVPEDIYGLIGRVTMLSALLENRLHVLLCTLASAPQDWLAGKPSAELIARCRGLLDRFRDEHRTAAAAFLDRAEAALHHRHEVVHSLWPFTGGPDVRGWRDVPARRGESAQLGKWTTLAASELPKLVTDFVSLMDDVHQVETWAQMSPPA